jgi:endo-1,4-beta-mannosidase
MRRSGEYSEFTFYFFVKLAVFKLKALLLHRWIIDHSTASQAAGKPCLMEEFGVTDTQTTTYPVWWNTVITANLTGDLIWQAGANLSVGETPNDGYAVRKMRLIPLMSSY